MPERMTQSFSTRSESSEQAPALAYAQGATLSDLYVVREGTFTRVYGPRRPWVKIWSDWKVIGGLLLAAYFAWHLVRPIKSGDVGSTVSQSFWIAAVVFFIVRYIVKLRRPAVFEVNPIYLQVGHAKSSTVQWDERWPIAMIGDVRANAFSDDLIIIITGRDMKEFPIFRDRRATEAAAEAIRDALAAARLGASARTPQAAG